MREVYFVLKKMKLSLKTIKEFSLYVIEGEDLTELCQGKLIFQRCIWERGKLNGKRDN